MNTGLLSPFEPTAPTKEERRQAAESIRRLTPFIEEGMASGIQLHCEGQDAEILTIPAPALRLLSGILTQIADGNAVTLTPVNAELTTRRAAAYLNVSQPFLNRLLETGEVPSRKVGRHPRVRLRDLMRYKQDIDAKRKEVLRELAAEAQELGMGY